MRTIGFLMFFASVTSTATAQEFAVRDVRGDLIALDGREEVVTWSLEHADPAILAKLAAGGPVVAVNTDPVVASSRIVPWLRRHAIEVTVVADPDGTVRERLARARVASEAQSLVARR